MSWDFAIFAHPNWEGEKSLAGLNEVPGDDQYAKLEDQGFKRLFYRCSRNINFAMYAVLCEVNPPASDRSNMNTWFDHTQCIAWLEILLKTTESLDARLALLPHSADDPNFEFYQEEIYNVRSWMKSVRRYEGGDFLWMNP